MPQNDGAQRPLQAISREGSFFNPQYPAPSGGRSAIPIRIFEVVAGAMFRVAPERALAAFSHFANPNIGGIDDRTGKPFLFYDLIFGGTGGRSNKDGVEGLSPVMNCTNIPVEVVEAHNPGSHPTPRIHRRLGRRGAQPGRLRRPQGHRNRQQFGHPVDAR